MMIAKLLKKRVIALFTAGLLFSSAFLSLPALGASAKDDINAKARRNKAIRMIESAENIQRDNMLMSGWLYKAAERLAPADTTVRLAINNLSLLTDGLFNPLYFPQLNLLEATSNPPWLYYYVLTQAVPPEEQLDSLTRLNTAKLAYKRFPDADILLDNMLDEGRYYILDRRYVMNAEGEPIDTLELSDNDMAVANSLLTLADSIEAERGYSILIDSFRLGMFNYLDREEDLKRLSETLWQRDSTDVRTLGVLLTLSMLRKDSDNISRLGLQRFKLEPDPSSLYDVYSALPNDTMRSELIEAVFKTVADTDEDPELRLDLLRAMGLAYYQSQDSIPETSPMLDRLSNAAREITHEDPNAIHPYLVSMGLITTPEWFRNYGYKFWVESAQVLPDSLDEHATFSQVLTSFITSENSDFEKEVKNLIERSKEKRPDLTIDFTLILAQHYFTSDQYAKALDVLKKVTLEDLRENARLSEEHAKNVKAGDVEEEYPGAETINEQTALITNDKSEDSVLKRWISVLSIMSDCQMKLRKVDDAFATMNGILAIDPNNAGILNNLAYYMCTEGRDLNIALSLANRSLEAEEDNINAIDTRAWIYFKQGNNKAALEDMEKVFSGMDLNMYNDILNDRPERTLEEIFEPYNMEAVSPFLGHLLLIAAKDASVSQWALWDLADFLAKKDSKNEDLAEFLAKNKRPDPKDRPQETVIEQIIEQQPDK